ncbi:hypothetical protein N4G70_16700 [Streptomyces sp. ASQP_92]|uniref:hypothetical protein n=1 Tax=Streptomyces sp. ASQP_92 TaxID=2979116 RepID=UPI0021C145E1|nr:hypothetical protein [Streptomyces sp. ASQP_92]MCT9090491.1 hypothetical protein [Streptomyces sp. ASQP_92]
MPTHLTPGALANKAAEAVRSLNHATQSAKGELTYPGDAYDVVASLKTLTQRLPQTFQQLAFFLEALGETDAVTADHGAPDEHLAEARSALASCSLIAQTLTEHLDRAHNALSPLGWSGPLPDTADDL